MDASKKSNDAQSGVLAALSLSALLSSFGTSSANVALPTVARAFDTSFQQVQWVVLAYLLAMTALIVGVGRLGDLVGRRRLLVAGLLVFTISSVLCAVAPTFWILVAARAAQGLGAAAMMALAMALVGEAVPKARTGSAMGLLGTMSAVGTALGPSLGGLLTAAFGWSAIFLVNVPLGLAAAYLARRSLKPASDAPPVSAVPFDRAGMLLLAATLVAYSLAMTAPGGGGGIGLLLAAFLGLGLFLATEARVASPLVRLSMFRNAPMRAGFAMSMLVTTIVMATLVVGPFYLSAALGLSPALVGAVMSVGPLVAALAGVPSGRLVDRFGGHAMTLAGLGAAGVGSCALTLTTAAAAGVWGYVAPLALVTAGYALFQAANNTAVMTDIAPGERGVVSGLLNLSRNLGLITGASLMGWVFALGSGAADVARASAEEAAGGMRATFGVATLLIAAALGVAWQARRASAATQPA